MVIRKGTPPSSEPWRILEVAQGQQPDIVANRFSKEVRNIPEKIEAVIPYTCNANGEPEWIIEHIYVRGANGSLDRLARVQGIERTRPEKPDRAWIETLLGVEDAQSDLPEVGNFVRVLTGPCAMMCGEIVASIPGTATVAIQLRTKTVTCYTFPENLQVVDAPKASRTFFYSSAL